MKVRSVLGIGAVLLLAAMLVGSLSTGSRAEEGGSVKIFGTTESVRAALATDIAELQKILAAAKVEKKDSKRAKTLALVIGLNAKAVGLMALHEEAGKVLAALADDNNADAKKAAAGLANAKGDGKAVDLTKFFIDANDYDRDLVMQLFKTPRAGGLGIESKIKKWGEDGVTAKDMPAVAAAAQKSAIIGAAIEGFDPPPAKKQLKKEWVQYAKDLQAAADEAIKAKDPKAAKTAIDRLDRACTACHDKFK
jgi:hypothetical protein